MQALQPGPGYDFSAPLIDGGLDMHGWVSARRAASSIHERRVAEAARLMADVIDGQEDPKILSEAVRPSHPVWVQYIAQKYPGIYGGGNKTIGLQESMAISDYQALYVDVLDRVYYRYYNSYPITTMPLVKKHTLRDFRTVSRYLLDGMSTPWEALGDPASMPQQDALVGPVPQNGATFGFATSTAPLQYAPQAYGCSASINWAAFINDDLGIFNDVAQRLAMKGNRGIAKYITQQFFTSTGPSTTLFAAGYRNLITQTYGAASNNPALSAQGLIDGLKVLNGMLDAGGDPIVATGRKYLVYGPKYSGVVENLLNSRTFQASVEGGTVNSGDFPSIFLEVGNWLTQEVTPIMDPYLPIVASSATGSWALVADPNSVERPAVEMGFLRGFETPQLYRKLPNTTTMSGAPVPEMGDFNNLNQEIKAMSVYGSKVIDGRTSVASNGSGS